MQVLTKKNLLLGLLITLIMGHYSTLCACADSLFLLHYSSKKLPQTWVITSLVIVIINYVCNKFNHLYSMILLLFAACFIVTISLVAILILYSLGVSQAIFALVIWKDAYFVILVEMYWSFISLILVNEKQAKRNYSWLMAMSTTSSAVMYIITGIMVQYTSTKFVLWLALPFLTICCPLAWHLYKTYADKPHEKSRGRTTERSGLSVVWNSKYLMPLLCLIMIVKISFAFIDFEFNGYIQFAYPDTNDRTIITSQLRALVSSIAVGLQLLFNSALRVLGFKVIFFIVPFMIIIATLFHVILSNISIIFIRTMGKALDYSFLKLTKEILYLPLNRDEKTKGKAFIDILVFRITSGLSSIILLLLIHLELCNRIIYFIIFAQMLWLALGIIITKRYENFTPSDVKLVN